MQDAPDADEILAAVAAFLRAPRGEVGGDAGRDAFQARVAAGAVELVRRQILLAEAAHRGEHERLTSLLNADGPIEALNAELAARLRDGRVDLDSPGVRAHLWETTLAKLAVDQPSYAGYRAALTEREAGEEI